MPKIDIFNLKREKVGDLELADEVFATEVKEHLFHEVVVAQLASRRAGTKAAKERSAVSGSSKKIYKQKGTGQARHGSIRAPIFVGGGRAHPPKPQDFSYRPPRQVRIGALRSALSMILKEGRLTVVDSMDLGEPKTQKLLRCSRRSRPGTRRRWSSTTRATKICACRSATWTKTSSCRPKA